MQYNIGTTPIYLGTVKAGLYANILLNYVLVLHDGRMRVHVEQN